MQSPSSQLGKNDAWGCAFLSVIGVVALFSSCGRLLSAKPAPEEPKLTAREQQIEFNRFKQAQIKEQENDAARADLLRQGYSPEKTEEIVEASRTLVDRLNEKALSGRP